MALLFTWMTSSQSVPMCYQWYEDIVSVFLMELLTKQESNKNCITKIKID